jgi:hypothetical protein
MLLKLGEQIRQAYERAEGCARCGRRLPPISRWMQRRVMLNAMVDLIR